MFDNKPDLLLATNNEGIDGTPNVLRRTKGPATKTPVWCPNKSKCTIQASVVLMFLIKKRLHINWIVKENSDFIWGCFLISSILPLWIVTLCIRSFVIQFTCLISKLLLQNRWLEGIPIGNDLFLWADQISEKPWSHHCQRKYQHTCRNSTRSSCDAIFAKMKKLTMKHLYLVRPVVCTCAVPKREIAF